MSRLLLGGCIGCYFELLECICLCDWQIHWFIISNIYLWDSCRSFYSFGGSCNYHNLPFYLYEIQNYIFYYYFFINSYFIINSVTPRALFLHYHYFFIVLLYCNFSLIYYHHHFVYFLFVFLSYWIMISVTF